MFKACSNLIYDSFIFLKTATDDSNEKLNALNTLVQADCPAIRILPSTHVMTNPSHVIHILQYIPGIQFRCISKSLRNLGGTSYDMVVNSFKLCNQITNPQVNSLTYIMNVFNSVIENIFSSDCEETRLENANYSYIKSKILHACAKLFACQGDLILAKKMWSKAASSLTINSHESCDILSKIQPYEVKKQIRQLIDIAQAQAHAGLLEDALNNFEKIYGAVFYLEDNFDSFYVLCESIKAQMEVRMISNAKTDFAKAVEITKKLKYAPENPNNYYIFRKSGTQYEISVVQAYFGLFDKALQTAKSIKDDEIKNKAIHHIVEIIVEKKLWDKALSVVESIFDSSQQFTMLGTIIDALGSAKLSDKIQKLVEKISTESLPDFLQAKIAIAHANAGLWDESKLTADRILSDNERFTALMNIAVLQMKTGLLIEGIASFHQAFLIADSTTDDLEKSNKLSELGLAHAKMGLLEEAKDLFDQSKKTACLLDNIQLGKDAAIAKIAKDQIHAGFFEDAEHSLNDIDYANNKSETLNLLAESQAKSGLLNQAKNNFSQARTIAKTIPYKNVQADMLKIINDSEAKAKSYVLQATSKAQAAAGDYMSAINSANEIDDVFIKIKTLEMLINTAMQNVNS